MEFTKKEIERIENAKTKEEFNKIVVEIISSKSKFKKEDYELFLKST